MAPLKVLWSWASGWKQLPECNCKAPATLLWAFMVSMFCLQNKLKELQWTPTALPNWVELNFLTHTALQALSVPVRMFQPTLRAGVFPGTECLPLPVCPGTPAYVCPGPAKALSPTRPFLTHGPQLSFSSIVLFTTGTPFFLHHLPCIMYLLFKKTDFYIKKLAYYLLFRKLEKHIKPERKSYGNC